MKRWLSVLLLALLLAAETGATAPEGFRESVRLTPRAQAISGNPEAVIYCARTYAAWETKVLEFHGTSTPPHLVRGMTVITQGVVYLTRPVCLALENWIRGKPASAWDVGVSALVLAHEAMHLRGVINELEAECPALRALPATLRRHFGVKKQKTLRAMLAAARTVNARSPNAC